MKKTIICDGDSWVFGSEITDPNLKDVVDWQEINDNYRLPKIFPTYLSEMLDADVVNLSWPADDNGTILHRIMTYISSNYISKGISTENILAIVGWSSPERNSFWYDDGEQSWKFRLWPHDHHTNTKYQEEIWKLYVEFLWNYQEYIPRYIMNILQFQNFCESNNIKWLCFNSFYASSDSFSTWKDLDVVDILSSKGNFFSSQITTSNSNERVEHQFDYISLWNTVDNIRFYKKDEPNNTFKSYIDKFGKKPIYYGIHPSPESHKIWAEELYKYIKNNNLL